MKNPFRGLWKRSISVKAISLTCMVVLLVAALSAGGVYAKTTMDTRVQDRADGAALQAFKARYSIDDSIPFRAQRVKGTYYVFAYGPNLENSTLLLGSAWVDITAR